MIGLAIAAVAAVAQPPVVVTVPPQHRLVEGVATDGTTIFVTSVLDRQILACTKTCRTIATLPEGVHPLGIAFDWGRSLLWIAADCPDVAGIAKCDRGALVAISRQGRPRGKWAPAAAQFHPGDVSATQSGIVVSDSQNGQVWGLLPRRIGLRVVNRAGDGKSAQGTALAPSGTELIVADYSAGIGRIDLKTKATTWLPKPDGKPSRGIDGFVRCGEGYLGVYNGGAIPPRLYAFRLRPGRIDRSELVDGLTLADPTQIAFDGKRLLVVSDSGWDRIAKGETTRATGARILAIPMTRRCTAL
ncbi:MAG TPA: hypothetical protein VKC17_05480 [Sphingomicrobium sp.]|nr:hypothetical protein [Sphingomicrobium sp.]